LQAYSKLEPAEREVLASEVQDLFERLQNRCLTRLATMVGVAAPLSPTPRAAMEQAKSHRPNLPTHVSKLGK